MKNALNSRPDSKLKRLDISLIREIVARADTPGVIRAEILEWLKKEHGVSSSQASLSDSLPFLRARVRSWEREQKIQAWLECEKLEHPELGDEELFRRGQRKFSLLSIAEEDPQGWVMIQKAARDKEMASLGWGKFRRETCELYLKWRKDEESNRIAELDIPNEEKIRLLRKHHFADVDELEKSGKVKIPK